MSDRNHQHHCPTAKLLMLARALQEMWKARYVSVLADEITSRKTRRKALLDFLPIQRTDVSNDSQKRKSSTLAAHTHVDLYFIVTFTLDE